MPTVIPLEQRKKRFLEMYRVFRALCEKHDIPFFATGGTAIGVLRHQGFVPWDDDFDVVMLPQDYERFHLIAAEELKGTHYRLLDCADDRDYPRQYPFFADMNTYRQPHARTPIKKKEYLTLGIDIFVYYNVPDDAQTLRPYLRTAWILNHLYYISVSPLIKVPLTNKALRLMSQAIIYVLYGIMKLLPVLRHALVRRWVRFRNRYHNKTSHYAQLLLTKRNNKSYTRKELLPAVWLPFEDVEVPVMKNYEQFLTDVFGDYMQLPPEEQRVGHPSYIIEFLDEPTSEIG
ncbi:MAG: LicD family protein [Coriobacteriales bacterium]|jgi:lipopolysaccharide cholinephosphotransferase|nr:LicD family protein [Coriobacteriales bacterium]